MNQTLAALLKHFIGRLGVPVTRVANQAEIPKQTLFNWCAGRMPRWHPKLPTDVARLARALALNPQETDELLLAAGCACAVDTPQFEEIRMGNLRQPAGWYRAGSRPAQYHMGVDPERQYEQLAAALIRSKGPVADGFGTLMQSCKPGKFLGQRVRLSAMTSTANIPEGAGLWMRIDGPRSAELLHFDNMQDRPLKGTTDWARSSVVLDVPGDTRCVAYGALLIGLGEMWLADVRLEIVAADVPTTNLMPSQSESPDSPVNLDFSE